MIERDETDGILTLRMAHGKASALDVELLDALHRALDDLGGARALVLTGTGGIFSAGVDLYRVLDGGREYLDRFLPMLNRLLLRLFKVPVPVVAAVNGHAVAGGAVMALACDYRLMADGSGRIGIPELLVGVPFPSAALEVVRFAVSRSFVQQLVYGGATLAPDEALAREMVDEVVPADELAARARAAAERLASIPADAFSLTKHALRAAAVEAVELRGPVHDAHVLAQWSAPATHERIRAYLDRTVKRAP